MAPQITHVSVPVLIHAADLYVPTVGEAEVAPALTTVVVPEVTALIVQVPTPKFKDIGFQGSDPRTDIRGGGILGIL